MDIKREKKRLLADYLAGKLSREEMEEQVRMLNGTLLVWKQRDGTYQWRDLDEVQHTGDQAAIDKVGKKYSLVLIEVLQDVPPITDEAMIPDDI